MKWLLSKNKRKKNTKDELYYLGRNLVKITAIFDGRSYKEGMEDKMVTFNVVVNENVVRGLPRNIFGLVFLCLTCLFLFFLYSKKIHQFLVSFLNNYDSKNL